MEKIKILEHKHVISVEPITCEDCNGSTDDFYEIRTAEQPAKKKSICNHCVMGTNSKYENDNSFYFINERREPIYGIKGHKNMPYSYFTSHSTL